MQRNCTKKNENRTLTTLFRLCERDMDERLHHARRRAARTRACRAAGRRPEHAAGRLVRLFPEIDLPSALAYATIPSLVAFRDWIINEASDSHSTSR